MRRKPKLIPHSFPGQYLRRYMNDPVSQAMLRRTAGMAPLSQPFIETALKTGHKNTSQRRVITKTDRPEAFAPKSAARKQEAA